jgi:hypothetical protein
LRYTYEGGPVFRPISDAKQDFPIQSGRVADTRRAH